MHEDDGSTFDDNIRFIDKTICRHTATRLP